MTCVDLCEINGEQKIVTSSLDKSVKVWDMQFSAKTVETLKGHSDWVSCCITNTNQIVISLYFFQSFCR